MGKSGMEFESGIERALIRDIRHHRAWFAGFGVLFLVLGVTAVAFPWLAAVSLDLFIGTLVLVAGVAQILHCIAAPRWRGTGLSIGLASLAIIAGLLMLFFPVAGVVTLTMFLAFFFLLSGMIKTVFAVQLRPAIGWSWIFTSGIVSLLLGLFILISLNEAFPWVLGLLLGIDFIATGVWMFALAAGAKEVKE